jgi:hypothetical protein
MVAQVDEAKSAQIAGDIGPAAKHDLLVDQGLVDEAAVMCAHGFPLGAIGARTRRGMLRRKVLRRNVASAAASLKRKRPPEGGRFSNDRA